MSLFKKLFPLWVLLAFSLACNAITTLPFLATATPTVTPTPTLTPTPTATPTPIPTPTPRPEVRVAEGDHALFNGDWDSALREYQAALEASLASEGGENPAIYTAALLGLGRTHFLAGNFSQAEEILHGLITNYPGSEHLPSAYFFLAQTQTGQEKYLEAADSYLNYLALRPGVIDSYLYELRGDVLFEAGYYPQAIADFQAALQATRAVKDLNLEVKTARAYALSGDYLTAIVGYRDIYARTTNDYLRARMDLYIGRAYTALGQMDQAYAAYQDAILNFPTAYDSYSALVALVEADVQVGELTRGIVDYHAGQYGVALAALDRYLQANPADPALAHYYKGLTQRALGNYVEAITAWDEVIRGYPTHARWDEAWEQKALTQWFYLDQFAEGKQTLLNFVAAVPDHPRAAEFLFDAAAVAERGGDLKQAAELWERLAAAYPAYDQLYRALFLAGISRYRLGEYSTARDIFQQAQAYAGNDDERGAAYFWSGKAQQSAGNSAAARADWEQAAALDNLSYYSQRARDLLEGRPPFTLPQAYDFGIDYQSERAEAEGWLRTVFALSPEIDLSSPGALQDDPRFQRGAELWKLGLYDEARAEFEDLREWVQDDPVRTYRLANHLIEIGLYRSGIFAARQVLSLAGLSDAATMRAPSYFNHLRFGTYFRDVIMPAAKECNLHPLLFFSLMRQESLFEGFVHSSAGARGLMQIIPTTGQEIAAQVNWPPNYTNDDLYRPLVSIRLGCLYFDRQRQYLNSTISVSAEVSLFGALAAYNGGPGNAATWLKLAPHDPDLFLEIIRYEETRNYLRRIYEIFGIYRQLYELKP